MTCPHCGSLTEQITDEEGEEVRHCLCGWYGYKSAEEMGIKLPKESNGIGCQGMIFKSQTSVLSRDAYNYTGADSGCKLASKILHHQSNCLECVLDPCLLDRKHGEIMRLVNTHRVIESLQVSV